MPIDYERDVFVNKYCISRDEVDFLVGMPGHVSIARRYRDGYDTAGGECFSLSLNDREALIAICFMSSAGESVFPRQISASHREEEN